MFNSYMIDKKMEAYHNLSDANKKSKEWKKWKKEQEPTWIKNHRSRIEKFVVSMENEDFDKVFGARLSKVGSQKGIAEKSTMDLPKFRFTTYQTEKEKIQKSIEQNNFLQTEPISQATMYHQFRNREKSKEIQPSMRFTNNIRRLQNQSVSFTPLPPIASKSVLNNTIGSKMDEIKYQKIHMKTTHSVLMQVGLFKENKHQSNVSPNEKSNNISKALSDKHRFSLEEVKKRESMTDFQKEKMKIIFKELYTRKWEKTKVEDQLQRAAQNILLKSQYIKKRQLKYGGEGRRFAEALFNTEDLVPKENNSSLI